MRSGDEAGFREFARERALPLRRTAFPLCGDWHLAEDIGNVPPAAAPELGLPVDPGRSPFGDAPTFDDRQLITLVTDPGFAAR